jgi:colanic acid/amylovoran biosynthesis protein
MSRRFHDVPKAVMKISDTKKMKICLIGASFETWNMGVSALAESAIKCIIRQWPEAEVLLIGGNNFGVQSCIKVMGKDLQISNIPIRFSKKIFHPNHFLRLAFHIFLLRLLPSKRLRSFLMRRNPCLKLILQTELFADITGGDSFSDLYGVRRFVWCFLSKLLPIIANKEFVLLPQTYGPFKRRLTRFAARYILRKAKIIYSRDASSADYAKKLLGNIASDNKVRVVPDVAFTLDPQKPASMDIGRLTEVRSGNNQVVGLNISGLLYNGGYTGDNMFGLREDYKQVVRKIVEFFLAKENVLLLLIPHVYPPPGTVHAGLVENDFAACSFIYDRFVKEWPDRLFIAQGGYNQSQIKYIIGLCDFFLGSRMHSCIAAISQEIPTVGLAYSQKFAGVFGSVGIADLVIDLRVETQKEIEQMVNKAFEQRQIYHKILAETIPAAKQKVLNVFEAVI